MTLTGIGTLWLDVQEASGPLRYTSQIAQRGIMTRASGHNGTALKTAANGKL